MIALVVLGSITGTVVFDGKAPAREEIERDSDPVCAKTKALDESVIVTNGKLRDVLVHVSKGAPADAAPATPVVISQHDCRYEPRVSAALVKQPIAIHNGDATYHNVHASLGAKTAWNESQPAGAADIQKDGLAAAGDVLALHCDVHAWMQAWVVAVDNRFAAVTGDDGAFTLANVPPGTYTIEAWHPTLGVKTVKVTVGAHKDATATFHFKAK